MSSIHHNNHSGASFSLWMEESMPTFPTLQQDLTVDICIVGGGFVGLTCAYLLSKKGLSVVVLEDKELAGGQSARTTGHLAWAIDDHYADLAKLFGREGALLAAESHRAAVHAIAKIVKEENIACDFESLDAYLILAPEDSSSILEDEWAAVKAIGFPIEKLASPPLSTFKQSPCLRFPDQAQFHVLKYLKHLISVIEQHKNKIFCQTHVTKIEGGDTCHVITENQRIVTAKSVIVATNTPINDRLMIHAKQAAYRTYVIAGLVPKHSIPAGLYYDTLDPYHYVRLQLHATDSTKEWLIVGGEDHKTGQDDEGHEKYLHLEKWTKEHFPMIESIDYKWSGQVIEPADSLAFIGHNPLDKNVFIATGDSGNGLTHGTIAGLLLTDLITQHPNPWEKLYQPSRKTLKAISEYSKENLNVLAQYGDWFMPAEISQIDEISPGNGALIRKGLSQYAVYKDEQGQAHCYSAVCPHLGCLVKWNQEEKSWDCPCHGSRFNTEGEVITGPANKGLKPICIKNN
jgi:glycine/D-amino acid oxidase-like deaminating enzyme/nitrite reductase/ring-hydroxylating ferredoxin subunit